MSSERRACRSCGRYYYRSEATPGDDLCRLCLLIDLLVPVGPWVDDALCAQVGGDNWFASERGRSAEFQLARRLCFSCPVREECLEFAVNNNIREGVWGGLSPRQRAALRRRTA